MVTHIPITVIRRRTSNASTCAGHGTALSPRNTEATSSASRDENPVTPNARASRMNPGVARPCTAKIVAMLRNDSASSSTRRRAVRCAANTAPKPTSTLISATGLTM